AHLSRQLDSLGGAAPPTSLPLPTPFTSQNSNFLLGIFSLQGFYLSAGEGAHNLQRQINIVGNTSIQIKSHSLKVGIDYRRLVPQFTGAGQYQVEFGMDDVPSAKSASLDYTTVGSSLTPQFYLH